MELDRLLWKDQPHLNIKTLWQYLCTYLYLPRLVNETVLMRAISDGMPSKDFFAYADRVDDKGTYLGLKFGEGRATVNNDGFSVLVEPEVAQKQINEAKKKAEEGNGTVVIGSDGDGDKSNNAEVKKERERVPDKIKIQSAPPKKRMRRFYGTVELDPKRAGRDAGNIAEAVIQHLTLEGDAKVTVTVEIIAEIPDGAEEKVIRTVSENCRTLKFKQFAFEEE